MKKLLILVDNIGPKGKYLADYLSKNIGDVEVFLVNLADVVFEINQGKLVVLVGDTGRKLSDFDFIYFRRVGRIYKSLATSIAVAAKYYDLKFVDFGEENLSRIGLSGDKFTSYLVLFINGLPVLPSVFMWRSQISRYEETIIKLLGLPLMAKEFSVQHGEGVKTIRKKSDFDRLPVGQYIFQKYVEIEREYRFLVMGNKVRSVQKMYRDTSEFELKIDMNKPEEFLPVENFPEEMHHIAIKGTKALGLEIGGADLAIEKGSEKIYLFEVNRGPGFTYDTEVSPEIPELAKFIKEKINPS